MSVTVLVSASDLPASYEWSSDLVTWHPSTATDGGTPEPQLFVRLKVVR